MNEANSFFTISKTANIIGVQSHVLRFWEKKFNFIKPKKTNSGRRYYSSGDIDNLLLIKRLLYEDGFTIKGAANFIKLRLNKDSCIKNDPINNNLAKITKLLNDSNSLLKKHI